MANENSSYEGNETQMRIALSEEFPELYRPRFLQVAIIVAGFLRDSVVIDYQLSGQSHNGDLLSENAGFQGRYCL